MLLFPFPSETEPGLGTLPEPAEAITACEKSGVWVRGPLSELPGHSIGSIGQEMALDLLGEVKSLGWPLRDVGSLGEGEVLRPSWREIVAKGNRTLDPVGESLFEAALPDQVSASTCCEVAVRSAARACQVVPPSARELPQRSRQRHCSSVLLVSQNHFDEMLTRR